MSDRQIMVQILGDAASLERAFAKSAAAANTFEAKMDKVGRKTTSIGKTMTRDVTLPLTALGVASVKTAQNFDLLISRMVGLGGVSEAQSKKFRQYILDLAPKVGKGPEELANGLYQIVSAGVEGKRALEALTVSAKASAAGLGDTATVADAVTSAMNAYAKTGLTAKQAADVLSAAVRDGKGEAAAFAPVLGKVVAVASQLGVPFDQAAAALAQMTKLGVPADDAATQLSATFSALLKTTPKAEKALEAMGLSSAGLRQELREKGLLATLETLNEKTKGSTVAMAEAFPNVRALRGVLQLVGTAADGTAKTFDDVKNSTDSLATAWEAYTKTDAAKMNRSLAQTKAAMIELGSALAPLADALAKDLGKVAEAYQHLSPVQKDVLIKLGEMAAVGGPLVLMTGKIITATGEIAKLTKALKLSIGSAKGGTGVLGLRSALLSIPTGITVGVVLSYVQGALDNATGADKLGAGRTNVAKGVSYDPVTGQFYGGDNGRQNQIPVNDATAAKLAGMTVTALRKQYPSGGMPGAPGLDVFLGGASQATIGSAGSTRVAGATGRITPGLAAVERFAGGRVNDDFATSGHATNSYHYKGQAADLAVDAGVWARLYANRFAFAELFGPWGLYHFGVEFYDAELQKQHMDHIHVAYTGGPQAISKMLGSGGGMNNKRTGAATTINDPTTTDPTYDPLAGEKKKKKKTPWKGATEATIITAKGHIAAMLKGLPADLDPVEQNAVNHIRALEDKLHIHMTPAELAKDRVELAKWGKVLHTEISKNAKAAAEAAAETKKRFDQALSLDMSTIMRDQQEKFAAQKKAFDKETQRQLKDMQTAFSRQSKDFNTETSRTIRDMQEAFSRSQQAFDRETQKGLAGFEVAQTPEEKALADFVAKRAADDLAKSRADQLANASTPEEKAALALGFSLDDQQAALQKAADDSRVAQDAKTADAQQAYQDQRDAQKQALQDAQTDREQAYQDDRTTALQALQDKETDLEQAYQDQRDLQWQALQDINDDQRVKLQNNLDDWTAWIEAKKKTYADFVDWARGQGIDTGSLVDPGSSTAPAGTVSTSSIFQASGGAQFVTPGTGAALAAAGIRQTHQLPKFATGGIVTRPTVALIGEAGPEAIVPLGRGGGAGVSHAGPTLVLNVIDDASLAARLKPYSDGLVRIAVR